MNRTIYNHTLFVGGQRLKEAWFNVFVDGWVSLPFWKREEAVIAQVALRSMGAVPMAYRIRVKPKATE